MSHIHKSMSTLLLLCMATTFATKQDEPAETPVATATDTVSEPSVPQVDPALTLPGLVEAGTLSEEAGDESVKSVRFAETPGEDGKKASRVRPISLEQALNTFLYSSSRKVESTGLGIPRSKHGTRDVYTPVSEIMEDLGISQPSEQSNFIDFILTALAGGPQVLHLNYNGTISDQRHPDAKKVKSLFVYHRRGKAESGPSNALFLLCPKENYYYCIREESLSDVQSESNMLGQITTGLVRLHYLNSTLKKGLNLETLLENGQTSFTCYMDSLVLKSKDGIQLVYNDDIITIKSSSKEQYSQLSSLFQKGSRVYFIKDGKIWARDDKQETPVVHHLPYERYSVLDADTLQSQGSQVLTEYEVFGKALNGAKNNVFFMQPETTYLLFPGLLSADSVPFLKTFLTPGHNQTGTEGGYYSKYAYEVQEVLKDIVPKYQKLKRSDSDTSLASSAG